MMFHIIITVSLLISSSFANTIAFDYCVADPTLPHGPSGYACKDPTKVTADDFTYSGLRTPGNTSNIFKFGVSYALVDQFPALNGMGLSMMRADFEVGGVGPIHAHRVPELAIVTEGTIIAGFIDSNNNAFYKTVEKGDIFVFPAALQHFTVNVGKVPAVVYAAFASSNPGIQAFDFSLFRSNLPSEIIQKTTLLDIEQIKKLKRGFGGSN